MGQPNTYLITAIDEEKKILLIDITNSKGDILSQTMSYDELTTQDKINAYVIFVYQQDKLKQAQVDSINKLVGVDQPIVDPTGKPIVLQAAPSPAVQVDPANG